MPTIPEKDWKTLREMKDELLQKACGQILDKISKFIEESLDDNHQTYLKLWKKLRQENSEIADMFDDMKRSQAIMKIFYLYKYKLIDENTLQQFSDETRERVKSMTENYG